MAVTIVETRGCHFCDEARRVLDELGRDHRLGVRAVSAQSPEGAALLVEHRPAMYPLVLVDGAYFSAGRLPRRKLQRVLAARARAVSVTPARAR